mmetsp:Transcript_11617/g.25400  ORF Transcript_11617/g.25400 Transcript_11617/m.25400 type:complete len:337 (-) Transcript_11617:258-1268(-)
MGVESGPRLEHIPHFIGSELLSLQSIEVVRHGGGSVVSRKGVVLEIVVGDTDPEILLHISSGRLNLLFHQICVHHSLAVSGQHSTFRLGDSTQNVVHWVDNRGAAQGSQGISIVILILEHPTRMLLGCAVTSHQSHLQKVGTDAASLATSVHRPAELARLDGVQDSNKSDSSGGLEDGLSPSLVIHINNELLQHIRKIPVQITAGPDLAFWVGDDEGGARARRVDLGNLSLILLFLALERHKVAEVRFFVSLVVVISGQQASHGWASVVPAVTRQSQSLKLVDQVDGHNITISNVKGSGVSLHLITIISEEGQKFASNFLDGLQPPSWKVSAEVFD